MPLIAPESIAAALTHFDKREALIRELAFSPVDGEDSYYKWILAFWLGSSTTRSVLLCAFKDDALAISPYLDWGYYCALTITRHMSLLQKESPAHAAFHHILLQFFLHYNEHYSSLKQAPKVIFYPLIHAFHEWNPGMDTPCEDKKIFADTRDMCLELLTQLMRWERVKSGLVAVTTKPFLLDFSSWHIRQNVMRFITSRAQPVHSFNEAHTEFLSFDMYKFLLPAQDGMILEGVRIRPKGKESNVVVLALFAQFQAEHNFINLFNGEISRLFNTDVVLINHRNFSLHSSKRAETMHDIALDIVSFVRYFADCGKSVVLYGHCAGAGAMLLASHHLMARHIPFKIIVDRFAARYTSFLEYKTIKRGSDWLRNNPDGLLTEAYTQFLPRLVVMIYLSYLLSLFILYITQTPCRFDNIINRIPETDLLILQAKGPKVLPSESGEPKPRFEDMLIHPDNDLRRAVKTQRMQRKVLLKTLKENGVLLSGMVEFFPEMKLLFQQVTAFFDDCLQCVSNEKLTLPAISDDCQHPRDIHSIPLSFLDTRYHVSIGRFVSGFYSKSTVSSLQSMQLLDQSMKSRLQQAFLHHAPSSKERAFLGQFTAGLNTFFNLIHRHEAYLVSLADRLIRMGKHNIIPDIQGLHDLSQRVGPDDDRSIAPGL